MRLEFSNDGKYWREEGTYYGFHYVDLDNYMRQDGIAHIWIGPRWVRIDTLTQFEKELYNIPKELRNEQ